MDELKLIEVGSSVPSGKGVVVHPAKPVTIPSIATAQRPENIR
ncbi:hypothetical protein [Pseudonocardia sp. TMWB2A]